ncbi:hypothetical protein N7493_008804 [Penicillium malachiteum]|uniref:Uncharacterized protein n=1 Tax=Penicillium malachiteum TaxID=1324776 RepID=A0AAD6MSS2_9EURO|nr:hypothetical protein N7493_008804 [Penicillium malachiteum]
MKLAFSDSKLASSNDFLRGENLVYGHRDTLMMMDEWHCPKLRELEFRGILVKEEWEVKSHYVLFSLAMTLLCSILIAAKFVFGEWGTAWTVGSFFLSLGSSLYGMMNIELAR